MESRLAFSKSVLKDGAEFAKQLTAYAHLINENNDLKRLKGIVMELKDKEVIVRDEVNSDV